MEPKSSAIQTLVRSPLLKWAGILVFGCFTIQNLVYCTQGFGILYFARAIFSMMVMTAFHWRKGATYVDGSLVGFLITVAHAICPFFFGIGRGPIIASEISWGFILLGLLTSTLGVVDLWEFFGILPAHRGLKTTGLYRYVRHPIYLGYLLAAVGWTTFSFSIRNLVVLIVFCSTCFLRIVKEERVLRSENPAYASYAMKTKFRMLPWIL